MPLYIMHVITILNILVYIWLSYTVGKKMWVTNAHRWFFALLLASGLWIICRFLENIQPYQFVNIIYFDFALAAVIAGIFVQFIFRYPNVSISRVKMFWANIPIFILVILSFTHVLFTPVSTRLLHYHPAYFVYISILFIYFIVIGGGKLIRTYRSNSGIPKRQLAYFALGYFISISILLYDSLNAASHSLTFHQRSFVVDELFFNSSIIFISLAAYSMIRYRFMDIRFAIQRGTIRAISLLLVLGVYFVFLIILAEPLFTNPKSIAPWVYIALGLFILGTVEPLRKYVTTFIDKRFELHDRQQERIQKQLQIVLKSQRSLAELEQAIRKAFQETAGADSADYVDADNQQMLNKPALRAFLQSTGRIVIPEELPYRLDEDPRFKQVNDEVKGANVTAYIPIGQNEIFVGCFALGQRKGKVAYSAQEVSAMKLLQSQATEAFLNARLYKQAVERIKV